MTFLRTLPSLRTWEVILIPVSVWKSQSECAGLCVSVWVASFSTLNVLLRAFHHGAPETMTLPDSKLTIFPEAIVTLTMGTKHFLPSVSEMHTLQIFCQFHWPIFLVFFVVFFFLFLISRPQDAPRAPELSPQATSLCPQSLRRVILSSLKDFNAISGRPVHSLA